MKILRTLLVATWLPLGLSAQTLVDLSFSSPVESTDVSNLAGLGNAYLGTTYRFLNVARGYDMKASITTFGSIRLLGSYPNYSSAAGEPSVGSSLFIGAAWSKAPRRRRPNI